MIVTPHKRHTAQIQHKSRPPSKTPPAGTEPVTKHPQDSVRLSGSSHSEAAKQAARSMPQQ